MTTLTQSRSAKAARNDAVAMLTADHKKLRALFKQFEILKKQGGPARDKTARVLEVCKTLQVHMQLEEEIFYPAVAEAIDDPALMDESEVQHAGARVLIEQLLAMEPSDALYDARVMVLGQQIKHHLAEEEAEMFVAARKADVDLLVLGAELARRRIEMMEAIDQAGDPRINPASLTARRTPAVAPSVSRYDIR